MTSTHPLASIQPFDALADDDALKAAPVAWPSALDGFVYFPGTIALKPFHRLSTADLLKEYKINFLGAVHTLQSAMPALKASGNASVVLFSTVAAAQVLLLLC